MNHTALLLGLGGLFCRRFTSLCLLTCSQRRCWKQRKSDEEREAKKVEREMLENWRPEKKQKRPLFFLAVSFISRVFFGAIRFDPARPAVTAHFRDSSALVHFLSPGGPSAILICSALQSQLPPLTHIRIRRLSWHHNKVSDRTGMKGKSSIWCDECYFRLTQVRHGLTRFLLQKRDAATPLREDDVVEALLHECEAYTRFDWHIDRNNDPRGPITPGVEKDESLPGFLKGPRIWSLNSFVDPSISACRYR